MNDTPAPFKPTAEQLQRYADGFNNSLTLRSIGVSIAFERDLVLCTLPMKPEHRRGLGSQAAHGGIISMLFDLAIGCSAALVDPRRRSATIQLSISFEKPLLTDAIVVEGKVDRAGGTTVFCSAVAKNDRGEVCARAQGLVKMSNRFWDAVDNPAIN